MASSSRKIALLAIDPAEDEGVISLNYSTRKIQAALLASPRLADAEVHLVESRSKDPDEFMARLEAIDPDVVGASGYVWSMTTFVEVARRVKRRRPDSLFILGGPSARPRMLRHAPFADAPAHIDAIVNGEGEEVMQDIAALRAPSRDALQSVPGIMIAGSRGWEATAPRTTRGDLGSFPSPYRMGLSPPGHTALIETFRGCPLSCTFCQWGDSEKLNRVFPAEYIEDELRALAESGAQGAALIDAGLNLNPRAFKNLCAAEARVGFFKTRNLYCEVYPSHLGPEHLEFLHAVRADRISVGLQSFDQEVLRGLERRFDERNFERVVRELAKIAKLVTVEIIMGLPGDNPRSFMNTLDRLLDLPCEARVFHCLVLPDALMDRAALGSDMKYDQSTLKMISCKGWSAQDILRTRELLGERAARMGGVAMNDWWEFPGPRGLGPASAATPAHSPLPAPYDRAIAAGVRLATDGAWTLRSAQLGGGCVSAVLATPEGELTLEARAARAGVASYRNVDGVAYAYRRTEGPPWSPHALRQLDRVIHQVRGVVPRLLREADASIS